MLHDVMTIELLWYNIQTPILAKLLVQRRNLEHSRELYLTSPSNHIPTSIREAFKEGNEPDVGLVL